MIQLARCVFKAGPDVSVLEEIVVAEDVGMRRAHGEHVEHIR
jgi:hypothetical protein